MEYQELYDKEAQKSENLTRKLDALNKKIARERDRFKHCIELAESKGDDFALYEAYLDDEDDDETEEEPQIAQGIFEDADLGRILALIQKRGDGIMTLRNAIIAVKNTIEEQEDYLKRIRKYNPSVIQSKQNKYLSHFYPVKPDEWLKENERTRHDMNSQTNSRLMIFMETFVRPDYRGLPRRGGKYGQMDLDRIPLEEVPFDPAYISDTFLRKFGFTGVLKGKDDLPALQRKERLIPAVKHFLENCVFPLPKTQSRTTDHNYRLFLVTGHRRSTNGKIINPHMDAKHERRIPSVFDSAFSCHRQTDHVFKQYQSESKSLSDTLAELKSLHARLKKLMGKKIEPGSNEEIEKNDIKMDLKIIAESLQYSFNLLKVIAQESLEKAQELKDSLDRENFGANLARLIKALGRLDDRKEEIFDMSLASPENAIMLEEIINTSSKTIEQYDHAFQRYIDEGNMSEFEGLKGTLQQMQVRPFNLYADRLLTCLNKMNRMKGNDKSTLRLDEATKALAITRLFKIQKDLEKVLLDMDRDRLPMHETRCRYLKLLFKSIDTNLPTHYQSPFIALKRHLEEIKASMKENWAVDNTEPSQAQAEDLKDDLKKIDFEKLLEEIK